MLTDTQVFRELAVMGHSDATNTPVGEQSLPEQDRKQSSWVHGLCASQQPQQALRSSRAEVSVLGSQPTSLSIVCSGHPLGQQRRQQEGEAGLGENLEQGAPRPFSLGGSEMAGSPRGVILRTGSSPFQPGR